LELKICINIFDTRDYFETGSTVSTLTAARKLQARKPPKLQHVLKNELKHGERQHDLVKKVPRIDGIMEADYEGNDYGEIRVGTIRKIF
jgi:ERCC4-type nuclease